MKWSRTITVVGAHCEGEIGRVITGGVMPVPGQTMLERLNYLNKHGDDLRRFSLFEPRGAAQMTVNLLLPPCDTHADAAFIPMQGDGSHAMSGSNAICVTTVLLETGILPMHEPESRVTLDTAAGLITATAACSNGKVTAVSLDFVPCFCEQTDVSIDIEGLGTLTVDVAFGGVFYVLVDVKQLNLSVEPSSAQQLVRYGHQILLSAQEKLSVQHSRVEGFSKVEFCMFTDVEDRVNHIYRNATIMPPGRLDRSPCGTGSAARLAVMHAKGEIGVGDATTMRSAIGSSFSASISGVSEVNGCKAVLPKITGRAWIFSMGHYGVDPSDPFPLGFTLSDTWGNGIEHVIPDL